MYIWLLVNALMGQGGTTPETTKIWTRICSCHNFPPPFFCANTFDTSLLLIVCDLRWYVRSLYRHLFLEDISKHARVIKKMHFLICGRHNSQAPWPTRPKLGVWVAKGLSCDTVKFFFFTVNPPPLSRSCGVEKRRDQRKYVNFFDPASSQHCNSGVGVNGKKKKNWLYHS